MPTKKRSKGKTIPWKKLWRDWGVFLVIVVVIAVVAIILSTRGKRVDISTASPYRIYFTQGNAGTLAPQGLEAEILADIATAKESVEVATPGLDLPALAAGLAQAQNRGVQVRVLEEAMAQQNSAVISVTASLESHGIPVTLHPTAGGLGESFVVVDQRVVWAGSWDLSQKGLHEDAGYVLRWQLAELASDFHSEFMEMFADKAFGPGSPTTPDHRYLTIPSTGDISVYMTPEGDPLAELLQGLMSTRGEMVLLSEGISDPRLGERLIGESVRSTIRIWGMLDRGAPSEEIIAALRRHQAVLLEYAGSGKLRENAFILDREVVVLFSQQQSAAAFDRNDGFVIIVHDKKLAATFQAEFQRLANEAQGQ